MERKYKNAFVQAIFHRSEPELMLKAAVEAADQIEI